MGFFLCVIHKKKEQEEDISENTYIYYTINKSILIQDKI